MLRQVSSRKVPLNLLVCEPPLHVPHLNAYMDPASLAWAVLMACHGAASNFAGLVVLRVFLGVLESTISPGLSLVTGLWYKRSEHASRHGIWFAGNAISSVFGGLLAYGIGHIHNSVEPWRVRGPGSLIYPLGESSIRCMLIETVDLRYIRDHHICLRHCLLRFLARRPSHRPFPLRR